MPDDKQYIAGFVFDIDPDRPIAEILAEIRHNSIGAIGGPSPAGPVLTPFAVLLVRLSRDSERIATSVNEKTQALIILTRILIFMTGILILLTIPIVAIETRKFFTEASQVHQHSTLQKSSLAKGSRFRDNRETR